MIYTLHLNIPTDNIHFEPEDIHRIIYTIHLKIPTE
jgi:hypothetical protein